MIRRQAQHDDLPDAHHDVVIDDLHAIRWKHVIQSIGVEQLAAVDIIHRLIVFQENGWQDGVVFLLQRACIHLLVRQYGTRCKENAKPKIMSLILPPEVSEMCLLAAQH